MFMLPGTFMFVVEGMLFLNTLLLIRCLIRLSRSETKESLKESIWSLCSLSSRKMAN